MEKGHFIFGLVIFALMVTLPTVALAGDADSAAVPTVAQPQQEETIKVLRADTGNVETYSLKDYIFGVVAAEMPMTYPQHAIKAQAVAAYTLTLHRMQARAADPPADLKGADMSDSSATDQAFITRQVARAKWGAKAQEYEATLDQWVAEVLGQYVAYQGQPALTVYHSLSGGRTESAETVWGSPVAYLVPVESVGDLMHSQYVTEKTVTKGEFLSGLAAMDSSLGANLSLADAIGEEERTPSGTVKTIQLFGKSFTGGQLREAFSLRSCNFDVAVSGDNVVFTVRGYGHLVGMSQFGAKTMAEQGSSYREILTWYYPGCGIMGYDRVG